MIGVIGIGLELEIGVEWNEQLVQNRGLFYHLMPQLDFIEIFA